MHYPKDYIIDRSIPFVMHLFIEPVANRWKQVWLKAYLRHATAGYVLNYYNQRGGKLRCGQWKLSKHRSADAAYAKANYILQAPIGEVDNMRRIVYGETRVDDLWDNWRWTDHR